MNKKHFQVPNEMGQSKLEIKDQLVYLVIKSHDNKKHECYPSLACISEESQLSVPTIRESIKRLEKEEYIRVEKRGKRNYYYFNEYKQFEPFSEEFLKRKDLTPTTKAYLIAAQQYMYKDTEGFGKISMSNRKLANCINTSEFTVRKCNQELERKNYLTVLENEVRDLETGCKTETKLIDLNKLGQAILWTLKNHADRITENTEEIYKIKEENEQLKKLVHGLEREINKIKENNSNKFIM